MSLHIGCLRFWSWHVSFLSPCVFPGACYSPIWQHTLQDVQGGEDAGGSACMPCVSSGFPDLCSFGAPLVHWAMLNAYKLLLARVLVCY